MRVGAVLAVSLLVLAGLPAPVSGDTSPNLSQIQPDVRVETWKDEPTIPSAAGDGLPTTPVAQGVYQNPYHSPNRTHQGVLGHYLGVEITLPSVSTDATNPDRDKYLVTAEIRRSSQDTMKAKLTKHAPDTFYAEFDLDGSRDADRPPLPAGRFDLVVEVYFVSSDPLHGAERVGIRSFPITNDPGRPTSAFTSLYPVDHLRKWRGIGGVAHVPLSDQVSLSEEVPLGFNFPASSDRSAEVTAYVATRRAPENPGGLGDVTVDRTVLHADPTDGSGTISDTFRPDEVLEAKQGDLLVVAGYLADPGELRVGASMLVIPASDATSSVTGYKPNEFSGPGPAQNQTAGFEVTVHDQSGDSRAADAVALWPGGTLITPARFVRSEAGGGNRYFANFAYQDIRDDGTPLSYRIYALLYRSTEQDTHEFHSMAKAGRGLSVHVPTSLTVQPGSADRIPITVTSRNTDGDGEREVGFLADATVEVRNLPGQGAFTKAVSLEEGETKTVDVRFPAIDPGTYLLDVNVSSEEVWTTRPLTVDVPGGDGGTRFTPGVGPGLVVLAAAAALIALRWRD